MQRNVINNQNLTRAYKYEEAEDLYQPARNFNIWPDWVMVVPTKEIFLELELDDRRTIDVQAARQMLAHFREYKVQQISAKVSFMKGF